MSSFCTAHFFSKKFQHTCVSLDVNFNKSLTNDVVSFEQLGPEVLDLYFPIFEMNLNLLLLNTTCPVLANSVDPDQLASEEAN